MFLGLHVLLILSQYESGLLQVTGPPSPEETHVSVGSGGKDVDVDVTVTTSPKVSVNVDFVGVVCCGAG